MQITTRTAVIPREAIETAYNDAVMSDRTALAREIAQLWLSMFAEQKFSAIRDSRWHRIEKRKPSDLRNDRERQVTFVDTGPGTGKGKGLSGSR